jgi:PBP1b-binding outer membrane lipoprotein LpoB
VSIEHFEAMQEQFGAKTFLIYVEPVFSKTGETIGVNYMGMEITDQVKNCCFGF